MPNLNLRGATRDVCCVERRAWAIHVVRRGGGLGREGEGVGRVTTRVELMRRALELRRVGRRGEEVPDGDFQDYHAWAAGIAPC